jgi:hypothetical protein
VGRHRWTQALTRLDGLLQRWAARLVEEHNEEVQQRLRAQLAPAARKTPSERLRRLAQEARESIGKNLASISRGNQQRILGLGDPIKFLVTTVLDPMQVHELLNAQDEKAVEQDLLFIRDMPRDFFLGSFEEIFERLSGGRWAPGGAPVPRQEPLFEESSGLWSRVDLRVLAATWTVE